MRTLYIAMISVALAWPVAAPTAKYHSRQHRIVEMTAEPKVRIRGDSARAGLSPLEFARWMKTHPRLGYRLPPGLFLAASPTRLLNRSAISFKAADIDGNGRISAAELADFVEPLFANAPISSSI